MPPSDPRVFIELGSDTHFCLATYVDKRKSIDYDRSVSTIIIRVLKILQKGCEPMFWTMPNVFEEMDALRREMQELMRRSQELFTSSGASFPLVNIYHLPEEVRVVAELPGVSKEELDVSYTNGILKIKGERKAPELAENVVQIRSERKMGKFEKSIKIPFEINPENIHAEFQNGLLQISLPKAEVARTRKITINA